MFVPARRGQPLRALLALLLALSVSLAGAQELRPWRGGPSPSLALQDLDGRAHRLEDYRGKVVLINFWATWCEPCRAEMPAMNKLRASFAGQPFAVLAINLAESESRIRRFLDEVPLEFPVLLDRDSGAARAWKARVLPVSFVVDAEGRIRYSALGEIDWTQESVRKAILALMPREAIPPRAGGSYSASSGTFGVVPLTTIPPRSPGSTLP
jgi:thiol-disulfide isomerase/thioredoxin